MRLNLYLRGIDLIDVEFHAGSKGLYLDLNVFRPREDPPAAEDKPVEQTADLSGTASGSYERIDHTVWGHDQPALVRGFGFQGS